MQQVDRKYAISGCCKGMCCDVVCVREAVLLWVSAVELLLCALALLHMAVLSSTRKKLL